MDLEEIRRIARLARIEIRDHEAARLGRQLAEIVDYFEVLRACDISAALEEERHAVVEASGDLAGAGGSGSPPVDRSAGVETQEDRVVPGLDRDAVLRNAPGRRDGFVSVPKIKAAHGETQSS